MLLNNIHHGGGGASLPIKARDEYTFGESNSGWIDGQILHVLFTYTATGLSGLMDGNGNGNGIINPINSASIIAVDWFYSPHRLVL